MKRREFFKTSIAASAAALSSSTSLLASGVDIHQPIDSRKKSKKGVSRETTINDTFR